MYIQGVKERFRILKDSIHEMEEKILNMGLKINIIGVVFVVLNKVSF